MEAYIASLKDVPVAPGHKQVYYPGEMETQADELNRATGLFLAEETLADLARISQETGIAYPELLQG
jgi:LDH2 family malate/lactate/ureidoglycolate dehydrogenase